MACSTIFLVTLLTLFHPETSFLDKTKHEGLICQPLEKKSGYFEDYNSENIEDRKFFQVFSAFCLIKYLRDT